jgi:hypothetical protein
MHIKKWCPSYCFGLQIISTVFSLWSRWIVFLLYVWGDVVSSRCCCWVVGRYTGIPYIDSCPVPAPWMRLGCTGPPWFSWDGIQKRYEEARWSTCAGLQLSSLTSYRRAEKPKMVSTSSSSPICGLRPRIRGRSMVFTEAGLSFMFAGGGVGTLRGRGGA